MKRGSRPPRTGALATTPDFQPGTGATPGVSRANTGANLDFRCVNSIVVVSARWSAWWEAVAEGSVVPPGDLYFEVAEAAVDEDGVVAAQVQCAGHPVRGDVQGAAAVQEVPPDGVGGDGVVSGDSPGQEPVEV